MLRIHPPFIHATGFPNKPGPGLARQSGASMLEFSIIAVPVLLLGLGSIELAQWFFNKQAVSLALLEAGRAAITSHAKPATIETAFEQALLPLFTTTQNGGARQRLHQALAERSRATGAAPWRIEILSPAPQAYLDFADPSLAIAQQTGLAAINNNYLAEQDQHNQEQGWANGKGPRSGLSILQANTLVLRLTYLYEPVLPGMKGLIRMLGNKNTTYAQHAMARGGYLPLVQEITLTMQSHPVHWPLPALGKVVGPGGSATAIPLSIPAAGCQGLWCLGNRSPAAWPDSAPSPGSGEPIPYRPPPASGQAGGPSGLPVRGNDANSVSPEESAVTPDDPACGVALCCVAA